MNVQPSSSGLTVPHSGVDRPSSLYLDAFNAFIQEFAKESDRASVILVGAKLDYLLAHLLERFLLANTGSTDELLDIDRPLGTFSARIHAGYRLGLISADFARVLHIFRRLRNDLPMRPLEARLT